MVPDQCLDRQGPEVAAADLYGSTVNLATALQKKKVDES
jgi:hypothetical protein